MASHRWARPGRGSFHVHLNVFLLVQNFVQFPALLDFL